MQLSKIKKFDSDWGKKNKQLFLERVDFEVLEKTLQFGTIALFGLSRFQMQHSSPASLLNSIICL